MSRTPLRFIVILADIDGTEWYAPVVEAPDAGKAVELAEDAYSNCFAVAALVESEIEHMLAAVREAPADLVFKEASH